MIKRICSLLLLGAGGLAVLQAQPAPKLNSLSPAWAQIGQTVEITFSGDELTNASGFFFSEDAKSGESGIKASELKVKDNKTLSAKIAVAADAVPGRREIRVVSPTGVSETMALNLNDVPEVEEKGTNNSPEKAQAVELPAIINGRIQEAGEVDYYRFHAKKGEKLIFDVHASRIGSPLDSSLAVLNAEGKELAHNEDAIGFDSLIEFAVPEDGDYLAQLRDFRYRGGGDYKYRLYAGATPYLDSIFPLGGQRGQSVAIALTGRNLGDSAVMTNEVDPAASLGVTEVRAHASSYYSNARKFEVGDLPEFIETEPNDTVDKANMVTVPVTINGRIGAANDVDVFKFKSDKGQPLLCEVNAQRLGSSLDALLTLMDSKGKVLAQNDDAEGEGMDARINYDKFEKDQEYAISIRDLNERGGSNFGYRLSVHPPRPAEPDFVARFSPDIPRLNRGGRTVVKCEVSRSGGFSGPVHVSLGGLPPGVHSEPLVMTTDIPFSGLMIISAEDEAVPGHFPIRLKATGVINGKTVTRMAEGGSSEGKRGRRRAAGDGFLTVLDTPPFLVDLGSLSAEADQAQTATVEVLAQRFGGFTNEIQLTAEGYSADREPISKHIDIPAATIKGDQSRGTLSLNIKAGAEPGTRAIVVKATSMVDGYAVAEYTQTLPLTIRQIPFTLAGASDKISVKAPADDKPDTNGTSFSVKVERRPGFKGEIVLTAEDLPEGVIAAFGNIPGDKNEITVKFTADDKAAVGKETSFSFVGVGTFNDRSYKFRTPPIKLTVAAPPETPASKSSVSFYHQVMPVLMRSCTGCHHPGKLKGELDLTTYASFKKGGKHGTGFKPGDAAASRVMEEVSGDEPSMPKEGDPLSKDEVAMLERWIREGARNDTPADAGSFKLAAPPVYTTPPAVSTLAYSPDGKILAVSGYHEVLLYDAEGSGLTGRLVGESPQVESICFSSDGKILAVAGGAPARFGEIQIWDPATQKETKSFKISEDTLYGASFSPENDRIAFSCADKSVRVITVSDGKQVLRFDNHTDWVLGTTFTHDGKHLLSGSRDRAMKLINVANGQFIDDINKLLEGVLCLARHPKEDVVAYGGDLGTPRIYRISDNQNRGGGDTARDANLVREFERQPGPVRAIAFSSDGNEIAVGGFGGEVRVYKTSDGSRTATLKGHEGTVYTIAFNPMKNEICTGGFDGKLRIFNANSGELVKSFQAVPVLASGTVQSAAK